MQEKCISCDQKIACIRYHFSLPPLELAARCKEIKKILRLTNSQIADDTGVPKSTVTRVFAEKSEIASVQLATLQPIVLYLLGKLDPAECSIPDTPTSSEQITRLQETVADLRTALQKQEDETEKVRTEAQAHNAYLQRTNRNKAIALAVTAVVALAALIFVIVILWIDRTDPTRGVFWLEEYGTYPYR